MEEKYKIALRKLIRKIKKYNNVFDEALLEKTYEFSYNAHIDQLRKSGEPYFEHPCNVANILADHKMDLVTICGGLLHDVAEDTGVSLDVVRDEFGDDLANLVDGVTKISELKFPNIEAAQAENFRKMIISMAKDIRVILIKFADRLHNMRTIEFLAERKRERIARETLEVYAPLAHRLGIARIKWELEDLSFKTLNPEEYNNILQNITDKRGEREKYIKRITRPVKKELNKFNIEGSITGRPKHFFSIYMKMVRRKVPFEEIFDLLAIRIIVKKVEDCYFALGIIHCLFTPIHEKFSDYIATPKSNMYQSLHTKVIGPEGKVVEIQIRTEDMHHTAEEGIAAHWKYKEGKVKQDELDRSLLSESKEFMEYLKIDLFHDDVFVFTPKGDLFRLPVGATPIDFAFAVHTDVGYHCLGAKVNTKIVPLNYQLKSGDSVEIITSNNQHPNPDWINIVKTSKARAKIKKWKRDSMFEQSLKLGEEILSKETKKTNIKIEADVLSEMAQSYGLADKNQLFAAIGMGDISAKNLINKLSPEKESEEKDENLFRKILRKAKVSKKGVLVQGIDNMMITFGKCCQPVPGDQIIGFITKGRGVVIHRTDCKNIFTLMKNPERIIDVEWDVDKDRLFTVRLYMFAQDRRNFLRDLSETLSLANANIVDINMKTEDAFVHNNMLIEVRNRNHLGQILKKLVKLKGMISVERLNGDNTDFQKIDPMTNELKYKIN